MVFAVMEIHPSKYDHALSITIYPLLLISTLLHPGSLTSRFLELPLVRFVGRISYSLYLWQMLFFDPRTVPAPGSFRSYNFPCFCSAFGLAIASYYLIEQPLIRRGHGIARKFDLDQRGSTRLAASSEIIEVR